MQLLRDDGFSVARGMSAMCMKWVWMQWLANGDPKIFRKNVGGFVKKELKIRKVPSRFRMRPVADLYLLHCAIFGSSRSQLEDVAECAVDASGLDREKPANNGELYASAWSGMLKHWILGDLEKAKQQAELIWGAYRHASFFAAPKPLVSPWIQGRWQAFVKAQEKDFMKLWARGRKDGTVRSESNGDVLVTVQGFPVEQKWCWAHCGLAVLAYRNGIEVATDAFWFPEHALKVATDLG